MAIGIGFPQANEVINKPSGMTAEECSSLEVYRDSENCISRWQFSAKELEELKANGGKCYLWVKGGGSMFPSFVTSISPWDPAFVEKTKP